MGVLMIRLKEGFQTVLKVIMVDERNKLLSKYNKTISLGTMKVNNDDTTEIIEEVYSRYKFDKEFYIGIISECKNDEDSSSNEEKVATKVMKKRMTSYNKVY